VRKINVLFAIFLLLDIPLVAAETWQIPISAGSRTCVIAEVDGKKLNMLLDTGSVLTIFRTKHGVLGNSTPIYSATGAGLATVCTVEMTIAGHMVPLKALCGVDLPSGQDGLLGQDFLQQFRSVTMDYRNHTLNLEK
jgi:predicted aspartyl protease